MIVDLWELMTISVIGERFAVHTCMFELGVHGVLVRFLFRDDDG